MDLHCKILGISYGVVPEKNITIYDGDLKIIREIKPSIGWIHDIADLGNIIAVASFDGLFLMTYMGRMYINLFEKLEIK